MAPWHTHAADSKLSAEQRTRPRGLRCAATCDLVGFATIADLVLLGLVDERLVDVRDDTATGNGGLDEGVELLVTTDGELKVAGGDALDLR